MTDKFHCFVFLVLACSFVQVYSSDLDDCDDYCYCRNTSISECEFAEAKIDITKFIFKEALNCWSPLAKEFKCQLGDLFDNGTPESSDFAGRVINLLSALNPYFARSPSACGLSAIIDGSICCIRDGDPSGILKAINEGSLADFYSSLYPCRFFSAINSLACPNDVPPPQIPSFYCEGNGFVYDFETAWDLRGSFIPCEVREKARQLYDSKDSRDNYIAALASYLMVGFNNKHFRDRLLNPILYEYVYLSYGPVYPRYCCDERIARLEYLRDTVKGLAESVLDSLLPYYSSCDACQNGDY